MTFNKVNCASPPFITGSSRDRISCSHSLQDQGEPSIIPASLKAGGCPQSRVSQADGPNSDSPGGNWRKSTHRSPASTTHLAPSQNDSSDLFGWTGGSEENFLDIALQESSEDSDDEWEEVICPTTIADRPLVAAPSGFTLPTLGKRSEVLTLEVVEDYRPSSPPSLSHLNDIHTPFTEDTEHHLTLDLAGEQDDSLEADLQLEFELTQGLAELIPPVPSPSLQPQRHNSDVVGSIAKTSSSHLQEAVEQPPTRASVKVKGKMVDRSAGELPRKVGKDLTPSTHRQTVTFKEKATELARSAGTRLFVAPKLPPPCISTINPPVSKKPSRPCTRAAPDSLKATSNPSTSKGFSHQAQSTRRGITDSMTVCASIRSPDASKDEKPNRRRRAQRNPKGKRVTKAEAEAEDVVKLCRSTKSYIVDMTAVKRRGPLTPPGPQPPSPTVTPICSRSLSTRAEKAIPSPRGSKIPSPIPTPVPGLPSQLLTTSLGGVPQGLKFTRQRKLALEPGEVATVTSKLENRGLRLASSSGHNGPLVVGVKNRRPEVSGSGFGPSEPRKKPRLCRQ